MTVFWSKNRKRKQEQQKLSANFECEVFFLQLRLSVEISQRMNVIMTRFDLLNLAFGL